jgi:hypothetical protein
MRMTPAEKKRPRTTKKGMNMRSHSASDGMNRMLFARNTAASIFGLNLNKAILSETAAAVVHHRRTRPSS